MCVYCQIAKLKNHQVHFYSKIAKMKCHTVIILYSILFIGTLDLFNTDGKYICNLY